MILDRRIDIETYHVPVRQPGQPQPGPELLSTESVWARLEDVVSELDLSRLSARISRVRQFTIRYRDSLFSINLVLLKIVYGSITYNTTSVRELTDPPHERRRFMAIEVAQS